MVIIGCIWFPSTGSTESQDSEFYANPLSTTAEKPVGEVKVQKPVPNEDPQPMEEKALEADFEKLGGSSGEGKIVEVR